MIYVPILEIDDSNMAGYEWTWTFYLNKTVRRRFTLSAKQTVSNDRPMSMASRRGLRDGVDIYDALTSMISELGYHLPDYNLEKVATCIARLEPALAADFLGGEQLSEQRELLRLKKQQEVRDGRLKPFRATIDRYVLRFDDAPRRFAPSLRSAAISFIEEYVRKHGHLPSGTHRLRTGTDHDFSTLGPLHADESE